MWKRVPAIIVCLVVGSMVLGMIALLANATQQPSPYTDEGYNAGKVGIPAEGNPYPHTDRMEGKHVEWQKGWQKGYLERKELTK